MMISFGVGCVAASAGWNSTDFMNTWWCDEKFASVDVILLLSMTVPSECLFAHSLSFWTFGNRNNDSHHENDPNEGLMIMNDSGYSVASRDDPPHISV